MYKTAVALVMIAALILTPVLPAYAGSHIQHTFALRWWSPGLFFRNGPTSATTPGGGLGLSYRADLKPPSHWSVSLNFDSMSFTPPPWIWSSASLFDVNVHYRFGADLINRYFGLFAGWGSVSVTSTIAPTQSGGARGFRFGGEFLLRQPIPCPCWVFSGSAAWGPSWPTSIPAFPMLAAGSTADYRLAIARELANGFGFELGWRSYSWTIPTSPGCTAPGCEFRFSGLTLGIFVRK